MLSVEIVFAVIVGLICYSIGYRHTPYYKNLSENLRSQLD